MKLGRCCSSNSACTHPFNKRSMVEVGTGTAPSVRFCGCRWGFGDVISLSRSPITSMPTEKQTVGLKAGPALRASPVQRGGGVVLRARRHGQVACGTTAGQGPAVDRAQRLTVHQRCACRRRSPAGRKACHLRSVLLRGDQLQQRPQTGALLQAQRTHPLACPPPSGFEHHLLVFRTASMPAAPRWRSPRGAPISSLKRSEPLLVPGQQGRGRLKHPHPFAVRPAAGSKPGVA